LILNTARKGVSESAVSPATAVMTGMVNAAMQ
jgi:hypothetical protein